MAKKRVKKLSIFMHYAYQYLQLVDDQGNKVQKFIKTCKISLNFDTGR